MAKTKRNCKHGLDEKQEIQARRIKDILIDKVDKPEKKEEYIAKLKKLYNECFQQNKDIVEGEEFFIGYLKEKDIVLYSAYIRAKYKIADFI